LLTQNVLLLQGRREKDSKSLKGKMKKELQKDREISRRDVHDTRVRFPTHTIKCVQLYIHSFIQPSAVLMTSDSLPKFTSL